MVSFIFTLRLHSLPWWSDEINGKIDHCSQRFFLYQQLLIKFAFASRIDYSKIVLMNWSMWTNDRISLINISSTWLCLNSFRTHTPNSMLAIVQFLELMTSVCYIGNSVCKLHRIYSVREFRLDSWQTQRLSEAFPPSYTLLEFWQTVFQGYRGNANAFL